MGDIIRFIRNLSICNKLEQFEIEFVIAVDQLRMEKKSKLKYFSIR